MHKGSCECGAVAFEVHGPLRAVTVCHCSQCRKTSGHLWAATSAADADLVITRGDGLKWFRSSDAAKRGFCTGCGSSLFYKRDGMDKTAIGAGTLDGETGLQVAKHIFLKNKGDYYDVICTAKQIQGWE